MIHEVIAELGAHLLSRGCPLPVVEGPENPTTTWGRERIVVEHTFDGDADTYGPPRSQHKNPKHRHTRTVAYKLTIYSQSKGAGASLFEHCRRAEKILDMVLTSMDYVAAVRKDAWEPKGGKFITPEFLKGAESPGGAVYELKFTFDRAVATRTWAGSARPTATLGAGGVTSITKVSQAHGPDDDDDQTTVPATAETACGA